ncbi:MAG: sorting protein [Cellvibrio sp.]|jgi:hypothetical protein|nr:sorting protein [Cellvibrio sp.]
MKLIQLAAAALITLSSLTAQAAYLQVAGGVNTAVPSNNYYLGNLAPQSYNIGGNLQSSINGTLSLRFDYLGHEAGWTNTFESNSSTITNVLPPSPFIGYFDTYTVGELIQFTFSTNGSPVPNFVANGNNNMGDHWVSFATALNTSFDGTAYDAILFFDDTGGYMDDDNHDDLVIGVRVLSATVTQVPESSTIVLMLMGLAGLFAARRMKA